MALQIKTGQYTGNASVRSITGIGFQPKLVIITSPQTSGGNGTLWSTGSNVTSSFGENGTSSGVITSLDADGFSLGTSDFGNKSSTVYNYIAFAGTDIVTGTYTGNGSDNRNITGVGFQPIWTIIQGDTGHTIHKMDSTGVSTDTAQYGTNLADISDAIQALNSDGFQVGTNAIVNSNTKTYRYACFKNTTNIINQSYTGNGTDNRNITTTNILPVFVFIKDTTTDQAAIRTDQFSGDSSAVARANTAYSSNLIQSFSNQSFQIGTDATTNGNTKTYHSIAIASATLGQSFTISETLSLSETITNTRARLFTISENLSLSETTTFLKGIAFTIVETLNLSETLTSVRTRLFTVSESLGLVEVLAQVRKKWNNVAKNQANFTNQTKHSATWTNQNKS